jgi:Phage tail assembly chaperone protein
MYSNPRDPQWADLTNTCLQVTVTYEGADIKFLTTTLDTSVAGMAICKAAAAGDLGPIAPFVPDMNAAVVAMRAERTRRLLACDWTQLADNQLSLDADRRHAWTSYRQALRDLPANFPQGNPTWPALLPPAAFDTTRNKPLEIVDREADLRLIPFLSYSASIAWVRAEKMSEATRLLGKVASGTDPVSLMPGDYPLLVAGLTVGEKLTDAARVVFDRYEADVRAVASIEGKRVHTKRLVRAAATEDEALAIAEAVTWP